MDNKLESVRLQAVTDSPQLGGAKNGNVIDHDEDDYDPHRHRNVPKATNNFETLVHLLKCSLGTGILAMPQAFARAGLVTGIISTIVIGVIITHCLHVLVRSQYVLCKRQRVPLLTYPASMTAGLQTGPPSLHKFAGPSAVIVDVFLVVYQLGICCVYIVFIAGNVKKIVDPYYEMSIEIHMLIILLPLILFNCIRNLKLLAPWSTVANILTFIGLGIVVYYLLADKKSHEPLDLWGSFTTFPLYFGTTLFALTAVGVVIALENNMKTPKDFGTPCGVLNLGMGFIVLLYVAIGAIGYYFCVSECSDSITLDLPQGPLQMTVLIMFAIAIFISYGLQCYVPVDVVWKGYMLPRLEKAGSQHLLLWEYGLRIVLCLLTFILAVTIPQLGLFISLFGALCLSALGIIFPAIMEVCVSYPNKFGPLKLKLTKDIILFFIGVIGLIAGTYATMLEIVKTFLSDPATATTESPLNLTTSLPS